MNLSLKKHLLPALPVVTGVLLAIWLYHSMFAEPTAQPKHGLEADSGLNVIMISWDGVRSDEFRGERDEARRKQPQHLGEPPLLRYFWQQLAPTGQIYGDKRLGQVMTIANPAFISLPAYQSIFAGTPQACQSNDCTYIETGTFPERLVSSLRLRRRDVATIASWEGLLFAVEEHPGHTFVNAGPAPLTDQSDAEELLLNEAQQVDNPPWADARFDRYTWRHAMRYLRHRKPRFLYVSLDDADGWGHKVKYDNYLQAIESYDHWLEELVTTLGGMGSYGRNTCLIVTTDHGRGRGDEWYTHSNGAPSSGFVMMYAGCPLRPEPKFRPAGTLTTHLDIRPTVEALFGLEPQRCTLCGKSLIERQTLTH